MSSFLKIEQSKKDILPSFSESIVNLILSCIEFKYSRKDRASDFSLNSKKNRDFFRLLLQHSVLNSFFIFDNKLYKQVDGLGRGLPLGQTFANIFMCHFEKLWLAGLSLAF